MILISTTTPGSGSSNSLAMPGCPNMCGNVSIPYPFGIGEGCFRKGFNVTRDTEEQTAYLGTGKTFKVFDINLSQGEARVQKYIAYNYYNGNENTGLPEYDQESSFRYGHSFTISSTKNKFTAIGCATIAVIQGKNQHEYTSACGSFCSEDSIENSTECTGMGCCQTSIPSNLRHYHISFLTVDGMNYTAVKNFSPCSYAFVAEADWFKFNTSYAKSTEFGELYYGNGDRGVHMVLDWVVDNKTCGQAKKTKSYACLAMNSVCIDVQNGLGYRCNCSQGYEGNPYLKEGCQGQQASIHIFTFSSVYVLMRFVNCVLQTSTSVITHPCILAEAIAGIPLGATTVYAHREPIVMIQRAYPALQFPARTSLKKLLA